MAVNIHIPETTLFVLLTLCMPGIGCDIVATRITCPQKCQCSDGMTVLKCEFLPRIPMLQLPSKTVTLFLKKEFIGPVFNQTFNHFVALETLDLANDHINFLQSGVFRNLIKLKRLNLRGNLLETLDTHLFFDTLQLEYLDLSGNRLRALPAAAFRFLPNLKHLNVSYNLLTSARLGIQFQVTTQLHVLDFTGNNIPFVSADDLAMMDGWEARLPKVVNFSRCSIRAADPGAIEVMKNVDFLGFSHNLDLEINNISAYLEVFRKVNLKGLDLSHTNLSYKLNTSELTSGRMGRLSIKELYLSGNDLMDIDNYTLTYLSLTKLDLSFNNLQEIGNGIGDLANLQFLDLSHNYISTVVETFGTNTASMETLSLAHNELHENSNLSLKNAGRLQHLDISFNRFKSFQIPVELENLRHVNLEGNSLESLNNGGQLLGLRKLEELNLYNNSISLLPTFMLRDSPHIRKTTFGCNKIGSISYQTFIPHSPAIIDLSGNNLVAIHNYGWHNVECLDLSGNSISLVEPQSFFFLDSLRHLDLSHNSLEGLDEDVLSHLTNLTHLRINDNLLNESLLLPQILNPLHNLEYVDLSNNKFKSFEFSSLPFDKTVRIEVIKLAGNQLTHLSPNIFSSIDSLKAVDFSRNSFTCDCKSLSLQLWTKKTSVEILGQTRYAYMCKAPAFRNGKSLLKYKVRTFECNRYLYHVLVFSSAGGAIMVLSAAVAVICHLCRKLKQKKKIEKDSSSAQALLIKSLKSTLIPNGKVANGGVVMNGNIMSPRENYIQHSPSDTLIDVQFENPLLNGDLVNGKRIENGARMEKRTRNGKGKAKQRNSKKNHLNNPKESEKYLKEVRFQHRNGSNSNKGSVSDGDVSKRVKSDVERHKRRISPKQEYVAKKRRPRGNKDLIRLLSLRESRSMPDVVGYINSLPRQESRSHRDSRYSRIPIVHIDHMDSSQNDWARSMVDLRKARRRSNGEVNISRYRYPQQRHGYARLAHGRVPEKYNTISSGHKTVTMATRPIYPERDHDHIGHVRAISVPGELSEWV